MPSLTESLAGSTSHQTPPEPRLASGATARQPSHVVVEEDAEEHRIREFNFATGPGSVAGRNATVIHITDDATADDIQRIQEVLKKRREEEKKTDSTGRRGGIVVNHAVGPGSIAGSNATIITSYRRPH